MRSSSPTSTEAGRRTNVLEQEGHARAREPRQPPRPGLHAADGEEVEEEFVGSVATDGDGGQGIGDHVAPGDGVRWRYDGELGPGPGEQVSRLVRNDGCEPGRTVRDGHGVQWLGHHAQAEQPCDGEPAGVAEAPCGHGVACRLAHGGDHRVVVGGPGPPAQQRDQQRLVLGPHAPEQVRRQAEVHGPAEQQQAAGRRGLPPIQDRFGPREAPLEQAGDLGGRRCRRERGGVAGRGAGLGDLRGPTRRGRAGTRAGRWRLGVAAWRHGGRRLGRGGRRGAALPEPQHVGRHGPGEVVVIPARSRLHESGDESDQVAWRGRPPGIKGEVRVGDSLRKVGEHQARTGRQDGCDVVLRGGRSLRAARRDPRRERLLVEPVVVARRGDQPLDHRVGERGDLRKQGLRRRRDGPAQARRVAPVRRRLRARERGHDPVVDRHGCAQRGVHDGGGGRDQRRPGGAVVAAAVDQVDGSGRRACRAGRRGRRVDVPGRESANAGPGAQQGGRPGRWSRRGDGRARRRRSTSGARGRRGSRGRTPQRRPRRRRSGPRSRRRWGAHAAGGRPRQ